MPCAISSWSCSTPTRGHGAGPIYSLFDQAFKSWRLSSRREVHDSVFNDLHLAGIRIDVGKIDPRRIEIAKSLGATKEPRELLALLKSIGPTPHRKGVIHGDLHVNNVPARGNDAVLIDFYSVNKGAPLAFDPATLEVSLAFAKYGKQEDDEAWKQAIDGLYDAKTFLRPPEPALQQHKLEWLWNCVRQLRTIGLSRQEIDGRKEYQTAVAFVLLRRMWQQPSKYFPEYRYAVGYLMAERLISDLTGASAS